MNYLLIFTFISCFNCYCMDLKEASNLVDNESQQLIQVEQYIEILRRQLITSEQRLEKEIKILEEMRANKNLDITAKEMCQTKITGCKNLLQSVRTIRNDKQ